MLYQKILVPLNGSDLAEKALPYARSIAKLKKSNLILFSVSLTMFVERRDRLFSSYLEIKSKELHEEGIKATIATSYGDVAEEIIKYTRNNKPDLIVMATHGYSGAKKWMFGSITHKVLYNTKIPVLLIKSQSSESSVEFNKILVPVDGSSFSESTFPHVEELSRNTKREVLLLHVSEAPVVPSYGSRPINPTWKKYRDDTWAEMEKQAVAYLDKVRGALKKKRIKVQSKVVKAEIGKVAQTIMQISREDKADLIIIATQGRSGVSRWVYGSIANRIMEESSQPVLLIRPSAAIPAPSPKNPTGNVDEA